MDRQKAGEEVRIVTADVNVLRTTTSPKRVHAADGRTQARTRRGKDSRRAKVDIGRGAEITDALRSERDAPSRSTTKNRNRPAPWMGIGDRSMHHSHEVTELDNLTGEGDDECNGAMPQWGCSSHHSGLVSGVILKSITFN